MPATADDVTRSIEPGSIPSGEAGPLDDRIKQAMATAPAAPQPGAAGGRSLDRLAQGPVSDKPVTDGLTVGPGASPAPAQGLQPSKRIDHLRNIAQNARSHRLRALARDMLRAASKKAR